MPSIFKSLTSITVWILFIFGLGSLLGGFGRMFMGDRVVEIIRAYLGFGVVSLVLAVVVAKIRQTMG